MHSVYKIALKLICGVLKGVVRLQKNKSINKISNHIHAQEYMVSISGIKKKDREPKVLCPFVVGGDKRDRSFASFGCFAALRRFYVGFAAGGKTSTAVRSRTKLNTKRKGQ